MAGTIQQSNVSTEEFLPDERVVDMDEKIRVLRPDESQFTTMTSRETSRVATREKVNWLEEEDFPRLVSLSAAAASGATTLVLQPNQGKIVRVNDVLRNMRTGTAERITAINADLQTLTVVRTGSAAAAASNNGDVYLVVGDAQPQGSDFPAGKYLARVLGFNYTEIVRTTWEFTGTATAIELYGGREPAKEAKRKAREHKKKWEAIGFFGARDFVPDAGAANRNEPQGFAGGLIEFITTNAKTITTLTADAFDLYLMDAMQYGTEDKVLFAAPVVVAAMSKWNRTGMGSQFEAPDGGTVHGVKIDAFISGAYGYRIPIIVKKEWQEFYNATVPGYGNMAFLVDMSYVERRPLRDRDTKLITEQQPKGRDSYSAEYMTEATFEIAHERAHGLIKGVVYS